MSAGASAWACGLAALPNGKFAVTCDVFDELGLRHPEGRRALLEAHVEFIYRYYAAFLSLSRAGARRRLCASVDDSGGTDLLEAAARGRGVVLLSAHLGDFDVAGGWLAAATGRDVIVVLDPLPERAREAVFTGVRRAAGITVWTRSATRLRDLEAEVGRGAIVLFMLDRRVPGPASQGILLGRQALLPVAPLALVQRTGAALVTATCVREGARRVLEATALSVAPERPMIAIANALAVLERQIRRAPWQWHIPVDRGQLPFARAEQGGSCEAPIPRLPRGLERGAPLRRSGNG